MRAEKFNERIGEIIVGSWERTTGEIPTSIQRAYLIDTMQGKINPELLLLLAAIRSIIGQRNYTRSTSDFIIDRMYGGFPWRKTTRYWLDKLFTEAMERGMLSRVSGGRGCRGFYVSIRYKPKELSKKIIDVITQKAERKQQVWMAGNDIAKARRAAKEQKKGRTKTIYPVLKAI